MNVLLKNVLILDETSSLNGQTRDLAIINGMVSTDNEAGSIDKEYDLKGKVLSPGLFDVWSDFCDPGFEHKEDIGSGCEAALHGGFTDVCIVPDTNPVIDSKSQLGYIKRSSSMHMVDVHPLASVGQSHQDKAVISEMRDLHENGALSFTGGHQSISNTELLLKALQYSSSFNSVVINRPLDADLTRFGQMHEGLTSTYLGMKGMPSISEKLIIQRDLELLKYAGGRLHFTGISSRTAVDEIRQAKSEGLGVTCDVPIFNLLLVDDMISDYDTNLKLDPPLRSNDDRLALIEGVIDGTIDVISSYHRPQDVESKDLEFDLADFGMISLQTFFPLLLKLSDQVPLSVLLHKAGNAARKVFGKPNSTIESGSPARMVVFDLDKEWVFDSATNLSKSRNSFYYGKKLKGAAVLTMIGNHMNELVKSHD